MEVGDDRLRLLFIQLHCRAKLCATNLQRSCIYRRDSPVYCSKTK